jgi:toxin ParE1/3/4
MMPIVRLSHLADGDLDSIRDAIRKDNPPAADRVLNELFQTLELLAANPEIGQRRDDLKPELRVFTCRPYVILYYASTDGIHVARVVHGARDFPAMFSGNL